MTNFPQTMSRRQTPNQLKLRIILMLSLTWGTLFSSMVIAEESTQLASVVNESSMQAKESKSATKEKTKKDAKAEIGAFNLEDGSRQGAYGDGEYGD